MKNIILYLLIFQAPYGIAQLQVTKPAPIEYQIISIESRIVGLSLSLLYAEPEYEDLEKLPVLFIHGASFPSELAAGFRMKGYSWMDQLAKQGYDVFALDHLGYGAADRYAEMSDSTSLTGPLGTGRQVACDIARAVTYILEYTGKDKINLIGHSWGATVSGYYASRYPEQVDKLVLFAPFVKREDRLTWSMPRGPYLEQTPDKRVAQFSLQLPGEMESVLAPEVTTDWGKKWLNSDRTAVLEDRSYVRYPAGWKQDLYRCWSGDCFFEPCELLAATLIVRGEWDTSFDWDDAEWLFENLREARSKRYVVIEKSTHVAHLEKQREQLYAEVQLFLAQ